jgi:hypothetical protein
MHKMILTTAALFSISLGAMENKDEQPTLPKNTIRTMGLYLGDREGASVDEIVQSRFDTAYNHFPKAFQNKIYTDYFKNETRMALLTMCPNKMVNLTVGKEIIEMPLRQCVLVALMNPKPFAGRKFDFQFRNWKATIERLKRGDVRDNDFFCAPLE